VTIEGETRALEAPFFVIATQNPLEQAGTFPLPESQMDRFLMRIHLGYPDRKAEKQILRGTGAEPALAALQPFMDKTGVLKIQTEVESDTFLAYLQDILEFTRTSGTFQFGLSPRAGLSLSRAARAWAYLHGRDHTLPEDLQQMLPWVAGHRLRSGADLAEFPKDRLMDIFKKIPVPV